MEVTYVDHMGSDLSVVNAARVSFGKRVEEFSDKDERLIKFLARENHWTPFAHTSITLHLKAPVFVARQLGKHQTGLVWNEVSRRYVDSTPEFFTPDGWRKRAENVKQGSSEEFVKDKPFGTAFWVIGENKLSSRIERFYESVTDLYDELLEHGVCPEQARMVLPQSMYTEWYWTGNLYSFVNVYKLRTDEHTQKETRDIAHKIGEVVEPLFPVSWKALVS